MKIKTSGKIADYRSSPIIGKQLILIVNDDIAEQLDQLGKQSLSIVIQPWNDTRKRSKNANAYMWQLLGALQEEGFGNPEENYRRYIRENGVRFSGELPEDHFETFEYSFTSKGKGFQIERTGNDTWTDELGQEHRMVEYVGFFGSHVYNRKQMSRLLDAIVQDCQAVGIQTETPEEQARMMEEWD